MQPLKVLFITNEPAWAESFLRLSKEFSRPVQIEIVIMESPDGLVFNSSLSLSGELALLATPQTDTALAFARALRSNQVSVPILIFCSRFNLPALTELETSGVQGIVSSAVGVSEIEQALYEVAEQQTTLQEQYQRATKALHRLTPYTPLTSKELAILRLAASDLTDEEVAEQLKLSRRTVSFWRRQVLIRIS